MPVVLKTQSAFSKPSPWSNFTFRNEISNTPETKAPKFQVKYDLVKRNSQKTNDFATVYEPTRAYGTTVQAFNAVVTPVKTKTETPVKTETFETQTETFDIKQDPEFLKVVTGIAAYERALAEEEISKIKKQKALAEFQAGLTTDFLNTFLYGKFKVPIEMSEELSLIMKAAQRVEGSLDKKGNFILRTDSQYNNDIQQQLNDWLDTAAAAGIQKREYTMDDVTEMLEDYFNNKLRPLKRKRTEEPPKFGKSFKKTKVEKTDKSKVSYENILLTKRRKGTKKV
jgi:hypothetical protein